LVGGLTEKPPEYNYIMARTSQYLL
jgi:hypothetical protein